MKAVIIAAGLGNRLWAKTNKIPKTLLKYGHDTILSTIMHNIAQAGIHEFVIVVGYNASFIHKYLKSNQYFNYDVEFVNNNDWNRGNGLSVLAVEEAVNGAPFILSMSDHVVTVSAIRRMIESEKTENLLLVDPKVDDIFDIDDATKVLLKNDRIINIGKEITQYNAIDCGVFRLNGRFFMAMREQLLDKHESISAAVKSLIALDDMRAVFMNDKETWIDIDTPEAYQHALDNAS